MFFQFTTLDNVVIDFTDYVDEVSVQALREAAVTSGGVLIPFQKLGDSPVAGFRITTEGLLFADNFAQLRSKLAQVMETRRGWLQMESDRRTPALIEDCDLREWVGGVSAVRLHMTFHAAGFAQDTQTTTVNASGNAWSVNNTGELPCPARIEIVFSQSATAAQVSVSGFAPDGSPAVPFVWKGDIQINDTLVIDSESLSVTLNNQNAAQQIQQGYPPWLRLGTQTMSFSTTPTLTFSSATLTYRRRWRFL